MGTVLRKQPGEGKEDPGRSRRPGQLLRYVIYEVLLLLKQLLFLKVFLIINVTWKFHRVNAGV